MTGVHEVACQRPVQHEPRSRALAIWKSPMKPVRKNALWIMRPQINLSWFFREGSRGRFAHSAARKRRVWRQTTRALRQRNRKSWWFFRFKMRWRRNTPLNWSKRPESCLRTLTPNFHFHWLMMFKQWPSINWESAQRWRCQPLLFWISKAKSGFLMSVAIPPTGRASRRLSSN